MSFRLLSQISFTLLSGVLGESDGRFYQQKPTKKHKTYTAVREDAACRIELVDSDPAACFSTDASGWSHRQLRSDWGNNWRSRRSKSVQNRCGCNLVKCDFGDFQIREHLFFLLFLFRDTAKNVTTPLRTSTDHNWHPKLGNWAEARASAHRNRGSPHTAFMKGVGPTTPPSAGPSSCAKALAATLPPRAKGASLAGRFG